MPAAFFAVENCVAVYDRFAQTLFAPLTVGPAREAV
jgi:hypothetical protein